jgi:hypothetical protein
VYKSLAHPLPRERIRLGEGQLRLRAELADGAVIEIVQIRPVRRSDARLSATVVHLVGRVLARREVVHAMSGQGDNAVARQRETGDPPTLAKQSWSIHGEDAVAISMQKQRDCYLSPRGCQGPSAARDEKAVQHNASTVSSALSRAARASYNCGMTNTCGRATHPGPSPGRTFP